MGFSTKKTSTTTTSPATRKDTPPSKPDFILKVKGEDGKFTRIGAAWGPNEHKSFTITFDEDIEFKSTADDRVKAVMFVNDADTKFKNKR